MILALTALHETLVIGDWHADSLLWNRNLLERGNYGRCAHGTTGLSVRFINPKGCTIFKAGLTVFGRKVVAEMIAKNMIVDLAHSSPQIAAKVLAMTNVPLIVSHTGVHGHCQTNGISLTR